MGLPPPQELGGAGASPPGTCGPSAGSAAGLSPRFSAAGPGRHPGQPWKCTFLELEVKPLRWRSMSQARCLLRTLTKEGRSGHVFCGKRVVLCVSAGLPPSRGLRRGSPRRAGRAQTPGSSPVLRGRGRGPVDSEDLRGTRDPRRATPESGGCRAASQCDCRVGDGEKPNHPLSASRSRSCFSDPGSVRRRKTSWAFCLMGAATSSVVGEA